MFLQKIYMIRNEFLRQHSRPWQKSKSLRKRNYPIAQSAERAACCPSSPEIPTPTCASVIILTSLAPSPMAKVTAKGRSCLTMMTISAFCLGETLHASTTEARKASAMQMSLSFGCLTILVRLSPDTIKANCFSLEMYRFYVFSAYLIYLQISTDLFSSIIYLVISSVRSSQAKPMLMAVSILSPVRTHNLIPASLIVLFVWDTPTQSLSSIAVAPTNLKLHSRRSATLSISSSLPTTLQAASS